MSTMLRLCFFLFLLQVSAYEHGSHKMQPMIHDPKEHSTHDHEIGHSHTHAQGLPPGLHYIGSDLVEVLDHCDPSNSSMSCGAGQCCVKEGLAFAPEYNGPKPSYRIACKMMGHPGTFCSTTETHEMCPCQPNLHCKATLGTFGHCTFSS